MLEGATKLVRKGDIDGADLKFREAIDAYPGNPCID